MDAVYGFSRCTTFPRRNVANYFVWLFIFSMVAPFFVGVLVSQGYLPQINSSLITLVSVLVTIATTLKLFMFFPSIRGLDAFGLTIVAVFLIVFFMVFFTNVCIKDFGLSIIYDYSRILFGWLTFFLIGYLFDLDKKIYKVVLLSWILMVFFTFLVTDYSNFRVILYSSEFKDFSGSYLFLCDSLAIVSLFLIGFSRIKWANRFLIFFITLLCLYVLASRASFYSYLVGVGGSLFLLSPRSYKMLTIIIFSFLLFLLFFTLDHFEKIPSLTRMLEPITDDGGQSGSVREYLNNSGYDDIIEHYVLGNLGGQVEKESIFGAYVHNVFSYWRQFGLMGVSFVIIYLMSFLRVLFVIIRSSLTRFPILIVVFPLTIFILIEWLFARSFASLFPWISVGLLFRKTSTENY